MATPGHARRGVAVARWMSEQVERRSVALRCTHPDAALDRALAATSY